MTTFDPARYDIGLREDLREVWEIAELSPTGVEFKFDTEKEAFAYRMALYRYRKAVRAQLDKDAYGGVVLRKVGNTVVMSKEKRKGPTPRDPVTGEILSKDQLVEDLLNA